MTLTYLACLTPAGTGAIATLALRGPLSWTLVRELAHRELSALAPQGRFWLTRLGGKGSGEADEVVVAIKQLTPEPWLELHCHGGREVVHLLEDLFAARGVEVCNWQQLERASSGDPVQSAALNVLTKAPTARTAAVALDQYQGALARALGLVTTALQRGLAADADRLLAELERYAPVGMHLATPWRVVIAGAANVGKSSLVNALAGYQRSVVSPVPGTTRDVVTTLLALDGWPVEVADTAGWRQLPSPPQRGKGDEGADDTLSAHLAIEREGIARARQAMASSDLCLWLLDASAAPVWPDANLGPVQFVLNKTDLPSAWQQDSVAAIRVSACTGAGLAEICQAIATWLVPDVPPAGVGIPFTRVLATGLVEIRVLAQAGKVEEALGKLEKLCGECD